MLDLWSAVDPRLCQHGQPDDPETDYSTWTIKMVIDNDIWCTVFLKPRDD